MSQAKHTPGPWEWDGRVWQYDEQEEAPWLVQAPWHDIKSKTVLSGSIRCNTEADARLIAAAPDLLQALEEYRIAHAMSSYGDYSAIEWESKAGPVNPDWGGGDCEKHGRWYGMCHCCRDEWKRLCDQSDRDAVRARNNALRAADDKANAAIAKATGCE